MSYSSPTVSSVNGMASVAGSSAAGNLTQAAAAYLKSPYVTSGPMHASPLTFTSPPGHSFLQAGMGYMSGMYGKFWKDSCSITPHVQLLSK